MKQKKNSSLPNAALQKKQQMEGFFLTHQNPEKAKQLARFFKTGEGEYGFGDKFLGFTVPATRKFLKENQHELNLEVLSLLSQSPYHEIRLFSVLGFVLFFTQAAAEEKLSWFHAYLKHTKAWNNWDLVDISAPNIFGNYLYHHPEGQEEYFLKFIHSSSLWEKRIAIVGNLYFIKNNRFDWILRLAEMVLEEKHDLMHKAVGWMLRELGKKNEALLLQFLKKHYPLVPRTTLRYSIERFSEQRRKKLLQGIF